MFPNLESLKIAQASSVTSELFEIDEKFFPELFKLKKLKVLKLCEILADFGFSKIAKNLKILASKIDHVEIDFHVIDRRKLSESENEKFQALDNAIKSCYEIIQVRNGFALAGRPKQFTKTERMT